MPGDVNTGGQRQNQTQNQFQNQNQTSTTTPWGPAGGAIGGLLGQLGGINAGPNPGESTALDALSAIGAQGNPFAGGISNVANTLLSGGGPDRTGVINDAYSQYRKSIDPFASGAYVDPSSNPELQKYLEVSRNDAANNIRSQFAGAGRDLSGMENQNVARGITQAEAPILYDAYNQARGQQINAINSRYGAGNTTGGLLSNLDQIRLGNMTAGVNVAGNAWNAQQSGPMLMLQAEAQRRGIPLQTLAAEMGIALPAGQAFGTTNAAGSGTMQGTMQGEKENTSPLWQQVAGGLLGGATVASKFLPF